MKKTFSQKKHQGGFAIGLILLAVVLISAIVASIATSTQNISSDGVKEEHTVKASALIKQALNIRLAAERYIAVGGISPIELDELVETGYLTASHLTPPADTITVAGTRFKFGIVQFNTDDPDNLDLRRAIVLENMNPGVALAVNNGLKDANGNLAIYQGRWTTASVGGGLQYAQAAFPFLNTPVVATLTSEVEYALGELFIAPAMADGDSTADLNSNGIVDEADFFLFQKLFFETFVKGKKITDLHDDTIDFNGDGHTNDQDWFDFINAWFDQVDEDELQPVKAAEDIERPVIFALDGPAPQTYQDSGLTGVLISDGTAREGTSKVNYSHTGPMDVMGTLFLTWGTGAF